MSSKFFCFFSSGESLASYVAVFIFLLIYFLYTKNPTTRTTIKTTNTIIEASRIVRRFEPLLTLLDLVEEVLEEELVVFVP